MKLNEHMKTIRKGLGLSQAAMAIKLGTNRNIYADYELGRTRLPADIYVAATKLSKKKSAKKKGRGRSNPPTGATLSQSN